MERQRDVIGRDWAESSYYDAAENTLSGFWSPGCVFRPLFDTLDLSHVAELACGHGRHAAWIQKHCAFESMTLVDINASNIAFCQNRFSGDDRFSYLVNSGCDLQPLPDASFTALFSYDAMVHFEFEDVISYVREAARVLRPGGRALLHHSNNDQQPGAICHDSTHWRNFMPASVVAHVARRAGFAVISQTIIDWGDEPAAQGIDCVSLLERPA